MIIYQSNLNPQKNLLILYLTFVGDNIFEGHNLVWNTTPKEK